MELRQDALGGHFVAGRQDDEDVFPFFGRFELVDAVGVGLDDQFAVAHQDIGHALAVAGHDAVDGGAGLRFHHQGFQDGDIRRPYVKTNLVAADIQLVVPAHQAVGRFKGEGGRLLDGQDAADIVLVGHAAEHQLVRLLDAGLPHQRDGDGAAPFVLDGGRH